MKKVVIIISSVLVIAILAITIHYSKRPKPIVIQGVTDAKELRISSKVPGRVDKIYVKEGDTVQAGQILVTIDAPDVRAKGIQADAASRAADAQLAKAESGARKEEIDALFSIWQKAVVGERVAKQTNQRVQQLFKDGVVSAQQRDEAQAKYDASAKDVAAAKAQYDMAVKGARVEDRDAAAALSKQAQGAVKEVASYLEDTILSSPIDGEISVVVLNSGELAGSGTPLISVTDLSDVYFVFNIREDLMPHFTMGKVFPVKIPALGDMEHSVKVDFISPRGDFATWSATKSLGQFDLRTFEVRARPVEKLENLRPGMSAIYFLSEK